MNTTTTITQHPQIVATSIQYREHLKVYVVKIEWWHRELSEYKTIDDKDIIVFSSRDKAQKYVNDLKDSRINEDFVYTILERKIL